MMLNTVRQYLASHHMHVVDEWLSDCVEYLTGDSSNNYSEKDVADLARQQWLLNDLNDICPGSLPPNLENLPKTVLNGRFVLQINAAIDIGTPAYQQYLKLQKINMENVDATTKFEDKISSHRMMKLYLTDGVQQVTAIEYKPMRNLNSDITPGCKVLLKGPVECRRGVLLLTEGATELLGGEVQEIAISNSVAGQLSAKLGVTILQAPDLNTTLSNPRNANVPTLHTQMPPSKPPDQTEPTMDQLPDSIENNLQLDSFNDDDMIDFEQLAAIEAQITDNPVKRTLNEGSSNPEKKLKLDRANSKTESTNEIAPSPPTNEFNYYPDDNDMFLDEDEEYLREFEAKIDAKENELSNSDDKVIEVSPEPFVYLKQINEMADSEKAGRVYKVKAQIMKLLSKLSTSKDGWCLKCTIVDGTGSLAVEFTSDVLAKVVGYMPQKIIQLKKDVATRSEAEAALRRAKKTLQELYCIIELTMLEVPKITRLIPFEAHHVDLLEKRMEPHKT